MSARNASKLFRQRSQTVMPRPPYSGHDLQFGLVQRCTIDDQEQYVGVARLFDVCPWRSAAVCGVQD